MGLWERWVQVGYKNCDFRSLYCFIIVSESREKTSVGNGTRYGRGEAHYGTPIESRMRLIDTCHFQWPPVTVNIDFKVTIFFNVKQLKNGTRELYLQWQTDRKSYMIHHILRFSIWDPLLILATVEGSNFKFGTQLEP